MEQMLNAKLSEIRKQKEQVLANFNALCGAEQILIQLIEELEKEDNDAGSSN